MVIGSGPAGQRAARDRIGERAAEIIHIGQAVMPVRVRSNTLLTRCLPAPTLADAYKIAAFEGLDKL